MKIFIITALAILMNAASAQEKVTPQEGPDVSAPSVTATVDTRDGALERPVVCFTAREMNDRVVRLRLSNPLIAMQTNARRNRAEPLRTRLCRSGNRLVYELSLIRKDGKVMQVYLNAQNGRPMAPPKN